LLIVLLVVGASTHEYGIFTTQLAVLPLIVAALAATSEYCSRNVGVVAVELALTSASQRIVVPFGSVETILMLIVTSIVPVAVVPVIVSGAASSDLIW
jgi:hypothetical protein